MKEQRFGDYTLTHSRLRFRQREVQALLALTYWAKERPPHTVRRSMRGAALYGVLSPSGKLVGFMRIVSDRSTVYYLADVVVADTERGKGLGLAMVRFALSDTKVCQGKGLLLTQTAAGLYEKVGFYKVGERLMIRDPVGLPR
ncbi:MAG TPA: GNAT family N-acetyltransferase [Candidatus Limiplasma sp.]|nr:GNAT family N-acetyltransferase [Candidatus Limiplasma sp.]HPS80583.1 GNAT family N-acetyltransferase [Candidatus Limiplasma sp.]